MALKAGLLGVGMMGRHHARVLREVEGVDLIAIADPGGDPHGVAAGLDVLPDVESLIAAGIDIAVVAVPTRHHFDAAMTLAEAGIHTLVEKPIAHSTEAGREMAHAFSSRGLVGAVGHVERFNPALQELRRRLANGDVGEVYQIATRRQSTFPARISDVGVVKDLATHDIDLTAWVAGSDYESVFAQTAYRSGRSHEDMVVASGRLRNGVLVNHLVNWLTPFKDRTTIVTGERGALVADTAMGDLTYFENGSRPVAWDQIAAFRGVSEGTMTRYALVKREPIAVEIEHFRDAILGRGSAHVTMAEGVATLEVVEAILRSASTGEVVHLAL